MFSALFILFSVLPAVLASPAYSNAEQQPLVYSTSNQTVEDGISTGWVDPRINGGRLLDVCPWFVFHNSR
jgi:hypothetical protein